MRRILAMMLAALGAGCAQPTDSACETVEHLSQRYSVCRYDPAKISIVHMARDGRPYGGFKRLVDDLAAEGRTLRFAMNGGMYESDLSPVGLLVTDGIERHPLNTSQGWGNFFLMPNGVFALTGGKAAIVETPAYAALAKKPDFATQSGPMLVTNGILHPSFLPQSDSLNVRNGVGVARDGQVVLAISDGPVRFHDFATLFRDRLNCPDALFLDGSISSLYAPGLRRNDRGHPMGPIIAVSEPAG